MQLVNATPFSATYSGGLLKSGRRCVVIVAKATFKMPESAREEPVVHETQVEPFFSDSFFGDPAKSAPKFETDFAPIKRRCDVILHGSAYAPHEEPAFEVSVGLQVGSVDKQFYVLGERHWEKDLFGGLRPSAINPFLRQPFSYDVAYGGTDLTKAEKGKVAVYMPNPVGVGYTPHSSPEGERVPVTEALKQRITRPNGTYKPMSFGPIARNWEPRLQYTGTYDQHWKEEVSPFLPDDFDERYYQCAPEDQQTDYLKGGERVVLTGLTPQGRCDFRIPKINMPMTAIMENSERRRLNPVIDTLCLEPDEGRFTLVWRTHLGIRQRTSEINALLVGKPSKGWEHARTVGKPYVAMDRLGEFTARLRQYMREE
jgi:hypothetical protein